MAGDLVGMVPKTNTIFGNTRIIAFSPNVFSSQIWPLFGF
uniref:Uncharacterized protein n=1 Tax=Anguilla anguilla TaxID=7936 RepID=A0A0E9RIT7_ANGAN